MSFVTVVPEAVIAAGQNLQEIGFALGAGIGAAVSPTTSYAAPAADEVSVAITALFQANAQEFQSLSARAARYQADIVNLLGGGAAQYLSAEAANVQQALLNAVNAPAEALFGRPLIGEQATAASPAAGSPINPGTGGAASSEAASSLTASMSAASDVSSSAMQNPVVATIPTSGALAVVPNGPHGSHVYVAAAGLGYSGTVSVIDTASNSVVATIPVGVDPQNVVAAPDGSHVYVSGRVSGGTGLVHIKTATNIASTPIQVGDYELGGDMVITPDGSKIYVPDARPLPGAFQSLTVTVFDTSTDTVTGHIPLAGRAPSTWDSAVIAPDGKSIYYGSDLGVSVISTATDTVTATVPGGLAWPTHLVMSPDASHIYMLSYQGQDISIRAIDTATNTVTTIPLNPSNVYQEGLLISPDGRYLYAGYSVSGAGSGTGGVSVIDTTTRTVTATIGSTSPHAPYTNSFGIALSPDGHYLYINFADGTGSVSSSVTIFNTIDGSISDPIPTDFNPASSLPSPNAIVTAPNGLIYVSNNEANSVSVINPSLISFHAADGGGTGGGGSDGGTSGGGATGGITPGSGIPAGRTPGDYLRDGVLSALGPLDTLVQTTTGYNSGLAGHFLTILDQYNFVTHFNGYLSGDGVDAGHILFEGSGILFSVSGGALVDVSNGLPLPLQLPVKALGLGYGAIGTALGGLDNLLTWSFGR